MKKKGGRPKFQPPLPLSFKWWVSSKFSLSWLGQTWVNSPKKIIKRKIKKKKGKLFPKFFKNYSKLMASCLLTWKNLTEIDHVKKTKKKIASKFFKKKNQISLTKKKKKVQKFPTMTKLIYLVKKGKRNTSPNMKKSHLVQSTKNVIWNISHLCRDSRIENPIIISCLCKDSRPERLINTSCLCKDSKLERVIKHIESNHYFSSVIEISNLKEWLSI